MHCVCALKAQILAHFLSYYPFRYSYSRIKRVSANFLTDFFTETETRSLSLSRLLESFVWHTWTWRRYLNDTYATGLELLVYGLALNWAFKTPPVPSHIVRVIHFVTLSCCFQ